MKRILLITMILLLTGCHTLPVGEVHSFINKYQSLDNEVIKELDSFINESSLSKDLEPLYKEVYLRQYQDLEYEILDYKCGTNICNIPLNIEVYDYLSIQKEALDYLANNEKLFEDENGNYDVNLYEEYKLTNMNKTKKRIKYVINVHLEKKMFNWYITPLDNNDLLKIHGIYE